MTVKDPPQHPNTTYPRLVTGRNSNVEVTLTIPSHEALLHAAERFAELVADLWIEGKLKIDSKDSE